MHTKNLFALILLLIIFFLGCKKDNSQPSSNNTQTSSGGPTNSGKGKLILSFKAMFGNSDLVWNNKTYINANGDSLQISTFKYYISNITLTRIDNSVYVVPNSYFLINHNAMGTIATVTLNNIPVGQYKSIKMMIGVDSVRNVSGAQTGDLDPSHGMFWSWTTGYIMLKLEGTSPQSGSASKSFFFHIGGFSGANNVLKWITPSFGSVTANVTTSTTPIIYFKTDLNEIFQTPYTINLYNTYSAVTPGVTAKMIADNYADMITMLYIQN